MAVNIVGGRYCPECGLRIVSNLVAFNTHVRSHEGPSPRGHNRPPKPGPERKLSPEAQWIKDNNWTGKQ